MFGTSIARYYNIISEIGIVGYLEEDIIKRGLDTDKNLPLNLLYSFPNKGKNEINSTRFQMMFPDDDHKIQTPKFFSLTLTDEKATRSFLYCLKFPEKFYLPSENEEENKEGNENMSEDEKEKKYVDVPLVIFIKSSKEDLEPFKQLLYSINQIIVNDRLEKLGYESSHINNYKKVQLMNLLHFIFVLPHTSPHSLVKLQLNKELDNLFNLNSENNSETIDFYFSSNCEIPCNKNDTDINILFLILDQSIIIKILFSILTEKQIIFSASQAYLLHLIICTFLKLIFPFKWHHSCITVVPKENLDLLDIPSSYIFGVLSSTLSTKDLIDEYKGKIIVDCDTNEIFGYSNLEPYEPPQMPLNVDKNNDGDKKKKEKEKKKDNDLNISNLDTDNFAQGKNIIIINKNKMFKYIHEIHGKKQKLSFDNDNNIIIDSQKSELYIDKNDKFIESREWKWLRRNIQLVRNPEIFNLDNIDIGNKRTKNKYLRQDEDNPILSNRPFSYNIQNIFLTFILKKLAYTESDFYTTFKKTNLFLEYQDTSKQYENMTGRKIVQNIEETKSQPRSINNCFNIEYVLNSFNIDNITDKIDSKINNKENKEEIISILLKLKKTFTNYCKIKEESLNINNDNDYFYCSTARKQSTSDFKMTSGSIVKPKKKGHVKNNTSVLQESCGHNKYILLGIDKNVKDTFQFYSKNGFIEFLNQFQKFLNEENISITKLIYNDSINSQIIHLINECFKEEETDKKEIKENKEIIGINSNLRNVLGVSIVPEKNEEETNENEVTGRESKGSVEIKKEEDYDFAENIMQSIKKENFNNPKIKGLYENLNEENIIKFPSFDFDTIKRKENKIGNEINHLMQYYLFLANYLEEAKNDKSSLNNILENIDTKNLNFILNENKENKEKKENQNNKDDKNPEYIINALIIKLYQLAYKNSDEKHRDFPYYLYYNFIDSIDYDNIQSFNELFDFLDENDILVEIYKKVIIEKQQKKIKKVQKEESLLYRNDIIRRTSTNTSINKDVIDYNNNNNNNENENEKLLRKSNIDLFKSNISSTLNNIFNKRKSIQITKSILGIENENNDCYLNSKYIINTQKEFESSNNDNISLSLINEIGKLLTKEFPNENDSKNKNVSDILEEMNNKIMENKSLIQLVAQLKYINLDLINTKEKCLAFWLNCFNYLILFAIFYKKWDINNEKKWKKFFINVHFNIGGKNLSFNDMQYLLFKKPTFLSSTYKPSEDLKKLKIENLKGDEKYNNYTKMIPFILFLPVKKFLFPSLYNEGKIDEEINCRIKKYIINGFIKMEKKCLCCNELLLKYDSNIFGKELKLFESFFDSNINLYNDIKDKKYKKINSNKITWDLTFHYLIENNNNDKDKDK